MKSDVDVAPPATLAHLVEAAQACSGWSGRALIGWPELFAWPAWALPSRRDALDRLVLRCGALRHADALRGCIDGSVLQAVSEVLGRGVLLTLLRDHTPAVPQLAALPRVELLEATWRAAGRALLVGGAPAALRGALLDHLGWSDVDEHGVVPEREARELSDWVQALPVDLEPDEMSDETPHES
jgi:hypothetical protein